jgi:hypothetical protein
MKKYILLLIATGAFSIVNAQPLYTENFNQLTLGVVSNDPTGTTSGQGGWFTQGGTAADYSIAVEPGKGNVLQFEPITLVNVHREVFRADVKTYWQQRTTGNNVLKFAFDLYTGDYNDVDFGANTDVMFLKENGQVLFGYEYRLKDRIIEVYVYNKLNSVTRYKLYLANGQRLVLPKNTWLILELYIDYNNNTVYYSIPALNYTVAYNTLPLDPGGSNESGGIPEKLWLRNEKNGFGNYTLKFDNINISAQNTVPIVTVGINEVLSNKFNLFPNPATNVVNITNSENMLVNQVVIYDIAGKQLSDQNFNEQAEIQLNVESLASGTYMLHLQTNEGTAVKKLVKK